MLKRNLAPLMLSLVCALLLAACGNSDTANNTTSTTSTSNNAATTTTSTTTTTNANTATATASPATATTTTTTAASGEKVGVEECDDYLAKYEACISGKVPEAARAQYNSTLEQMRKSWRTIAASPQGKAGLAQACKTATESARTALKSDGCSF